LDGLNAEGEFRVWFTLLGPGLLIVYHTWPWHVTFNFTFSICTYLFWCLEPCRCAWYCATEFSVTLQTSQV